MIDLPIAKGEALDNIGLERNVKRIKYPFLAESDKSYRRRILIAMKYRPDLQPKENRLVKYVFKNGNFWIMMIWTIIVGLKISESSEMLQTAATLAIGGCTTTALLTWAKDLYIGEKK